MRENHLNYLVCPKCHGNFTLYSEEKIKDRIKKGKLKCNKCGATYPIINFIPRFVPEENYASSFGYQWNKMGHLQYDSFTKKPISEERFFKSTKWPRNLKGEVILEAGSGAGRFTEVAAKTGAFVISFDYSNAVEINYHYNGHKDNVLIVQADIYAMPFPYESFDRVFCFGVLQHLPDPKKGFMSLVPMLKKKGKIAVDIYKGGIVRKLLYTKYWVRPFTKRINKEKLFRFLEKWIDFWWGKTRWISKRIPGGRLIVKNLFLIADYTGVFDLDDEMLKKWALLDSFDMLSPAYDNPQTLNEVKKWFLEAGLTNIEVEYGYNGIVGRGEKP
ncbi:MAG: methyltransferase domain-containing protein [Candidatus Nanohaloarchaeota archaeon]|nr:methyltransferase domain-containing protein [Candidatus Nanohaloarchaeota archaeon]